ncbi:MAG TPA: TlpA disulfide reductase family protein [Thermoleophilaceae bacterium]
MNRRRVITVLGAAALIAVVVIGLISAGGSGPSSSPKSAAPSATQVSKELAGAPAPLAALHNQANQLLPGGASAFQKRLAELRGHPVVVNKWASWCGPCRAEFPHFQQASVEHGKQVAFIGVDSSDNNGQAQAFLKKFPVSYPSYEDGDLKIAQKLNAVGAFPTTVYYDSKGRRVGEHIGVYQKASDLESDIKRYAQ